jgi:starch synthase
MALGVRPDVIHCNDWQTGLVPLYLKSLYKNSFFKKTATVFTIHNLGYQGLFSASDFLLTGLGGEWFTPDGIEFYGKVNFLKAGLIGADSITTVSLTYAKEILTPQYGHGLEGVLKKRSDRLYGILNGIDTEEWNPRTDPYIPATYEPSDTGGKALCRKRLMEECMLKDSERFPLAAIVGRLSEQKGLDILIDSVEEIISMGARLIMLGKGDERLQTRILEVAERYKELVFVKIGYDVSFAHRIYAGSDIFLMPSQYEPCGLGQMIAMTYGTIPVARKTGGLADTIVDYEPLKEYGTGFLFEDYRAAALRECMKRALCFYTDGRRWNPVVSNAMMKDFSWASSAAQYLKLYAEAREAEMRRA